MRGRRTPRRGNAPAPRSLQQQFEALWTPGSAIFDADNLSGSDWVDYVNSSRALALNTGTLAAPSANAALGGANTVAFTGTQRLVSNQAASFWAMLHGAHTSFTVWVPTVTTVGYLWGTGGAAGLVGGSQRGGALAAQESTDQHYWRVANATVNQINVTPVSAYNVGTGVWTETQYGGAGSAAYVLRLKGASIASGNAAGTHSSADPTATLSVGTDGAGGFAGSFALRALYFFDYVLSAAQRAVVLAQITADTGLT